MYSSIIISMPGVVSLMVWLALEYSFVTSEIKRIGWKLKIEMVLKYWKHLNKDHDRGLCRSMCLRLLGSKMNPQAGTTAEESKKNIKVTFFSFKWGIVFKYCIWLLRQELHTMRHYRSTGTTTTSWIGRKKCPFHLFTMYQRCNAPGEKCNKQINKYIFNARIFTSQSVPCPQKFLLFW